MPLDARIFRGVVVQLAKSERGQEDVINRGFHCLFRRFITAEKLTNVFSPRRHGDTESISKH